MRENERISNKTITPYPPEPPLWGIYFCLFFGFFAAMVMAFALGFVSFTGFILTLLAVGLIGALITTFVGLRFAINRIRSNSEPTLYRTGYQKIIVLDDPDEEESEIERVVRASSSGAEIEEYRPTFKPKPIATTDEDRRPTDSSVSGLELPADEKRFLEYLQGRVDP